VQTVANETILIIDDDPFARDIAGRFLEVMGHRVLTAQDGITGVQLFKEFCRAIKAVVLDFMMPGMNGDKVYQEIVRIRPDVPIIVCSGSSHRDIQTKFPAKGVVEFLSKPFSYVELESAVRKATRV